MNKKCVIDIETESLDPKEGRIVCIGTLDVENSKTLVFYDDDEQLLLRRFLDFFHNNKFNEIIGYNLMFDIRYIFARCMKHNIPSNGFFKSEFNDLMHTMKSVRKIWSLNRPGTLEQWSVFLFGKSKRFLSDSVEGKYKAQEIDEIIAYNEQDLQLTFMLWKRIQEVLYGE
jgi:DNA polymerase elongation subunit (family B)